MFHYRFLIYSGLNEAPPEEAKKVPNPIWNLFFFFFFKSLLHNTKNKQCILKYSF